MAKTSAADKSRPLVEAFAKYHFWLLALVVPLVMLPSLLMARGQLAGLIDGQQKKIDQNIKELKGIRSDPQHPNEFWVNDLEARTVRIRRETFAEWRRFWAAQQPLRVWPASLGPDFEKMVESLKPDGKLSRKFLERYQNNAVALVRDLPKRMGAGDGILDSREPGETAAVPGPDRSRMQPGVAVAVVDENPYKMTWDAADQNRIASSFKWDKVPSTTQVLLAQEELWVYGLLCDALARVNKSAAGPHDAAISQVSELAVGYLAAEDNPGGQAGGRIKRMAASPSAEGVGGPMPDMGGPPVPGQAAGSAGRPPHPRFTGTQRAAMPMAATAAPTPAEAGSTVSPDDQLRNWIYVNFDGKPLDSSELAAAADCQMVHLMPFTLRVVIDERRIDALLVELSTAPIPIDVRQLRINTTSTVPAGAQPVADPAAATPASNGRFYDVNLELRGTVGLATMPDEKAVGLEPGGADTAGAEGTGDKSAALPRADGPDRFGGRRRES